MRSAAVIVFIALVAAVALYCAQRPTIARGSVLAADLVESNPAVLALDCDPKVPIGLYGARFTCKAHLREGDELDFTFAIDREGRISVVEQHENPAAPVLEKTSDPWAD